jgi:hypothetical protein
LRADRQPSERFGMLAALLLLVTLAPIPSQAADTAARSGAVPTAVDLSAGRDSLALTVVFRSTGGTITPTGAFTAGVSPGSFVIIAASDSTADSVPLAIMAPPKAVATATRETPRAARSSSDLTKRDIGIPFGPFGGWGGSRPRAHTESFTLMTGSDRADAIIDRIRTAQSQNLTLITNMTGGAHENYMTGGVFDVRKWQARMDTYNTPAIQAAVAEAVADGTLIGNSVMDEPHVRGIGDGNTWGPPGTMTKARVDGLCAYAKAIFPTLPVGVVHQHRAFEPDNSYKVCEFIVSQYASRLGSVTAFRDAGLAYAKRDGISIAFSMNILNGGNQAPRDGLWYCPSTTTGGRGTFAPNCRMTAAQVRDFGLTLGTAGCAMLVWRYDEEFMANPEHREAFQDIAAKLATLPRTSCKRP